MFRRPRLNHRDLISGKRYKRLHRPFNQFSTQPDGIGLKGIDDGFSHNILAYEVLSLFAHLSFF